MAKKDPNGVIAAAQQALRAVGDEQPRRPAYNALRVVGAKTPQQAAHNGISAMQASPDFIRKAGSGSFNPNTDMTPLQRARTGIDKVKLNAMRDLLGRYGLL